ncbi:MAG: C4-type zinc ribbon domain-containing protein [Candidatus Omnitrophota bacterium]
MDLKEEIRKLVELQKVDSEIYKISLKKNSEIPEKLNLLKNEFEQRKKEFEAALEAIKQLQLKKKEKELNLATKEEAIKKSQGQLFQLKTNKDYQTKLTEIASLKADASLFEEEVLKAMEGIEAADKKAKEEKEMFAQEEKNYKEKQAALHKELEDIESQTKTFEERKAALGKDIDKNILARYEKLIKTRSGLAVCAVDVETENCGACHMRMTSQKINEIKMYSELTLCENCVRILYIPEDFSL